MVPRLFLALSPPPSRAVAALRNLSPDSAADSSAAAPHGTLRAPGRVSILPSCGRSCCCGCTGLLSVILTLDFP